jgi:hypothetical protein
MAVDQKVPQTERNGESYSLPDDHRSERIGRVSQRQIVRVTRTENTWKP